MDAVKDVVITGVCSRAGEVSERHLDFFKKRKALLRYARKTKVSGGS